MNVYSRNDDLHATTSSAAHRQFLTSVQRFCGGHSQWQIEAMRRIEIPEDMRKKHGFQPLGPADGLVKGAIFAYNASRVYAVDLTPSAVAVLDGDGLAAMRREYLAAGAAPSNLAYGFVAKGDGNG